ncbi:MAG: hypothetical protein QOE54_5496 [Streptosporangiaceae bacterium]|jgi:hypothetical protein|nr:hypothetical protein [Streptosporangiaceae bacterium]MDX6433130.1 hypothetical protein [Streptosporangiaceae bacterium]
MSRISALVWLAASVIGVAAGLVALGPMLVSFLK